MPNAAPLKLDPYKWWSIVCPRCGQPVYNMQDIEDFGESHRLWVCPRHLPFVGDRQHGSGKFVARRFGDTIISRAVPMSWATPPRR